MTGPSAACRALRASRAVSFALLGTLAALAPSAGARAEVVRFEVLESAPAFEGRAFGNVGPYVRVTARATITCG